MKKAMKSFLTVILCSIMFVVSCGTTRTMAPKHELPLSSTYSLQRNDYDIIDNISAEATVAYTSKKGLIVVKSQTGEFINVCKITNMGPRYLTNKSKGTLKYGHIADLNLGSPNPCDGRSMASFLAAYKFISKVKSSIGDNVIAPTLEVSEEEIKGGIQYRARISAKLIKIKKEASKQVAGTGNTELEHLTIHWNINTRPQGADCFWRVKSSTPDVKNQNEKYLAPSPYESTETYDIKGLSRDTAGDVQIEIRCTKAGYMEQKKVFNALSILDEKEISILMQLVKDE